MHTPAAKERKQKFEMNCASLGKWTRTGGSDSGQRQKTADKSDSFPAAFGPNRKSQKHSHPVRSDSLKCYVAHISLYKVAICYSFDSVAYYTTQGI